VDLAFLQQMQPAAGGRRGLLFFIGDIDEFDC
jgi:hypothetical protein